MRKYQVFQQLNEFYAAGYFENECASYAQRHARGIAEVLGNVQLPEYTGSLLYPAGNVYAYNDGTLSITFSYPFGVELNFGAATAKARSAYPAGSAELTLFDEGLQELQFSRECEIPPKFAIGGLAFTHGIIHYRRAVKEGLLSYARRIDQKMSEDPVFYGACRETLHAICTYHARCLKHLRASGAPERLIAALEHGVLHGAADLYEAFCAANFLFYIDGADSMGRVDAFLAEYVAGESPEAITELFRALWSNFDATGAWHVLLDGANPLALPAILAQREFRRPNSGILIDGETPDAVWEGIFDAWMAHNPSPSLYSRSNYRKALSERYAPLVGDDALNSFAFGGCTELMFEGISNVQSIEGGVNVLKILDDGGWSAPDFDAFYQDLLGRIRAQLNELHTGVLRNHRKRAEYFPQLIRTLFVDDCLDRGKDFNAGGARYRASCINVAGLTNLINSVYALHRAFAGRLSVTPGELRLAALRNFAGDAALLAELRALPKFGNACAEVDELGKRLCHDIFESIYAFTTPERLFFPAVILFVTYATLGVPVGATPDGRLAHTPLADSFGAMQGTDTAGPTALLNSATTPEQAAGVGTLILNLRLNRSLLTDEEGRKRLKALLLGYFAQGGLQVQVTVMDSATLQKACADPAAYSSLIIRIGGYSEYFTRLSPELQQEVIKRTEQL